MVRKIQKSVGAAIAGGGVVAVLAQLAAGYGG